MTDRRTRIRQTDREANRQMTGKRQTDKHGRTMGNPFVSIPNPAKVGFDNELINLEKRKLSNVYSMDKQYLNSSSS